MTYSNEVNWDTIASIANSDQSESVKLLSLAGILSEVDFIDILLKVMKMKSEAKNRLIDRMDMLLNLSNLDTEMAIENNYINTLKSYEHVIEFYKSNKDKFNLLPRMEELINKENDK